MQIGHYKSEARVANDYSFSSLLFSNFFFNHNILAFLHFVIKMNALTLVVLIVAMLVFVVEAGSKISRFLSLISKFDILI